MTDVERLFAGLVEAADQEFRRNRKLHGRRISCREGCTECCQAPFHITELEAARVSAAVAAMPADRREALRLRAEAYLGAREALFAREGYLDGRGSLAPPGKRLTCPALEAGACQLYADRPVLCRRIGAPVYYPSQPNRLFSCEKNIAPGETVQDPRLVTIQTAIDSDKGAAEQAYERAGGKRYPEPITVAHAILEDFRTFLPDPEP